MGSKIIIFLFIFATVLAITSEVGAREMAETSKTPVDNAKAVEKTEGVEEAGYTDRSYGRAYGGGGGYGGGRGGGGYGGGGGGGGGGHCRHGCCGHGYHGCKCCVYPGQAFDAEP